MDDCVKKLVAAAIPLVGCVNRRAFCGRAPGTLLLTDLSGEVARLAYRATGWAPPWAPGLYAPGDFDLLGGLELKFRDAPSLEQAAEQRQQHRAEDDPGDQAVMHPGVIPGPEGGLGRRLRHLGGDADPDERLGGGHVSAPGGPGR